MELRSISMLWPGANMCAEMRVPGILAFSTAGSKSLTAQACPPMLESSGGHNSRQAVNNGQQDMAGIGKWHSLDN